MTGVLFHLARFCGRHKFVVLGVWLLIFLALAFVARTAGTDVNDNVTLPGTGSQNATDLLSKKFPSQANGTNPVVLTAPKGEKVTDSKYKTPIDDTVKALKADPDVRSATSPLTSDGSAFLAKNKEIGYIAVNLKTSASQLTLDDANRIVALADPARDAGLEVGFGGYLGQKVSKPETHISEVVGLSMAVIVLLITFGTAVAMSIPIITAIIGLVCGLSIITLISHVADVPTTAPTLATMIGLGVGIDYALFIVTRHLEQRRDGMATDESIYRATATSGGAVVFAGCTVMIALLSLAIVGIPLVTTLGYTSALVVAVAVLGAITLLPCILSFLGDSIDKGRIPLPHRKEDDGKPHGWHRWGEFVSRHPLPAALVALVILVLLAIPALGLYLGQQDNGALSKSTESRKAYDGMSKAFGVGSNGPLLISVDMSQKPAKADQSNIDKVNQTEKDDKQKAQTQADDKEQQLTEQYEAGGMPADEAQQQAESEVQPGLQKQLDDITKKSDDQRKKAKNLGTDPRLQDLRDDIKKTAGVKSVTEPLVNKEGTAAVITATPTTSPSDEKTADLVTTLRDSVIPKATDGKDMSAFVGGTTASYVDLADEISSRLILTILIVIALSFLLLTLAFRSLVIPLTAGLMNLVSIGAAFGVVSFVFEDGHGASLLGLPGEVPIVSYVPLLMFAILFGLSMDYEVFLMTHIKEAWERTKDNKAAVVEGIGTTGRVITSAALIMVSVFSAFILVDDPTIKQFGVGMAVAVAVDATIVRCLLVPSVMILIGKANWWFPHWLDRLMPNFSIEGDEWFREHDAKAAEEREEAPPPVPAA
ncbi:MAG: MMPL family transporter [Solirubrobacteraceae bacterium]